MLWMNTFLFFVFPFSSCLIIIIIIFFTLGLCFIFVVHLSASVFYHFGAYEWTRNCWQAKKTSMYIHVKKTNRVQNSSSTKEVRVRDGLVVLVLVVIWLNGTNVWSRVVGNNQYWWFVVSSRSGGGHRQYRYYLRTPVKDWGKNDKKTRVQAFFGLR